LWFKRVEELFEARPPKTPAVIAEIDWQVSLTYWQDGIEVLVQAKELWFDSYRLSSDFEWIVEVWEELRDRQIIAKSTISKDVVRSKFSGTVHEIQWRMITIKHSEKQSKLYKFRKNETLKVENWDIIQAGSALNSWHFNIRKLVSATDVLTTQKYILKEVQTIYASQWQSINDKHLEIIVKQMFARSRIIDSEDSNYVPGQIVEYINLKNVNIKLEEEWKTPAKFERLVLGLTRVSLSTNSWLSSASFQETIRVLVEASTTRKIDHLEWLKENVIIGKLIPAGQVYRDTVKSVSDIKVKI